MARKRRPQTPTKPAATAAAARSPRDLALISLASAGVLVTAYLSLGAIFGSLPALCSEGSGCEIVQGSRFSRFLGVPVALWGLLTYVVLLVLAAGRGARAPRWKRLWTVSLVGLAVSLYLTLAGAIALEAFCGWCLVSQTLILAIFLLVQLEPARPAIGWGPWLGQHAIVLVALLGVMHANASGLLFGQREDPRLVALAQHLDRTGAKYYGAFWCPNCQQQKDLFGPAQAHLPYVECNPRGRSGGVALECVNNDIIAYPTWIIRGQRYTEVLSTDELAQRSGFRWNPPGG